MKWSHIFLFILILSGIISCHHRHSYTRVSWGISITPVLIQRSEQSVYTHDEHIHDEFCGHPKKWYNDRWVYFYNGRWEYFDPQEGVYYYLPKGLIEDPDE